METSEDNLIVPIVATNYYCENPVSHIIVCAKHDPNYGENMSISGELMALKQRTV